MSVFPRSVARAGQKNLGFVWWRVSEVCLRYGLHSESRYVSELQLNLFLATTHLGDMEIAVDRWLLVAE